MPAPHNVTAIDGELTPRQKREAAAELLAFVRDGKTFSEPLKNHVVGTLEAACHAPGTVSLDIEFGMKVHGGLAPHLADRKDRRNTFLLRLWQTHPSYANLTACAAAKVMAQEASRYEQTRWPRERKAGAAPSAEPAATFWRILRMDEKIPGAKQLQIIFEREFQEGV